MEEIYRYSQKSVFGRPGVPIFANLTRQGETERPHDHDFIEWVVVHKGTAIHETVSGRRRIGPGTVLALRPEVWHAYRKCRDFEIYNCCFGAELLRHELGWLIEDEALGPLLWGQSAFGQGVVTFKRSPDALARATEALRDLIKALAQKPPISRNEAAARLAVFLTALPLGRKPRKVETSASTPPHPQVLACLRQLEGRLERDWRLGGLARENGVSREHLIRLFKQKIGCTPMAYLDRCRAERAAGLLKRTALSIGEIGEKVGWSSPVTLSRRFKVHFGISARDYRARASIS